MIKELKVERIDSFLSLYSLMGNMTILIDKPLWHFKGERFSHLASDSSYEELHDFASKLGIPKQAFHGDHYDIPERFWQKAVDLGATATDSRELVRKLRKAGLRKNYKITSDVPTRERLKE